MIAVAVAFDREAAIIIALNHDIDAMLTHAHLRIEGISLIMQGIEDLALKIGFAAQPGISSLFGIVGKGRTEMLKQCPAQFVTRAELIQFNRTGRGSSSPGHEMLRR